MKVNSLTFNTHLITDSIIISYLEREVQTVREKREKGRDVCDAEGKKKPPVTQFANSRI